MRKPFLLTCAAQQRQWRQFAYTTPVRVPYYAPVVKLDEADQKNYVTHAWERT